MNKRNFGVVGYFGDKLLVRVIYTRQDVWIKTAEYLHNNGILHKAVATHKGEILVEYAVSPVQLDFIKSFSVEGEISRLERKIKQLRKR